MSAGAVFFGFIAAVLTDLALARLSVDRGTTALIVLAITSWFAWLYYMLRRQ